MDPEQKASKELDGEKKEGEEEEEENEEKVPPIELEDDSLDDPFLTYPEPSHRAHTPAERIRPRSSIQKVTSYTEYNPYIGTISLKYPRKRRGALPNSLYRRPPEIIPPPVDKWQLYKSEIGVWKPMSLTTICRKFDPAWKDRDENDVINDGY